MSANARNSKLINTLVNNYKDDYTLVNLLKISNLAGERMEEIKQLEIYNFWRIDNVRKIGILYMFVFIWFERKGTSFEKYVI